MQVKQENARLTQQNLLLRMDAESLLFHVTQRDYLLAQTQERLLENELRIVELEQEQEGRKMEKSGFAALIAESEEKISSSMLRIAALEGQLSLAERQLSARSVGGVFDTSSFTPDQLLVFADSAMDAVRLVSDSLLASKTRGKPAAAWWSDVLYDDGAPRPRGLHRVLLESSIAEAAFPPTFATQALHTTDMQSYATLADERCAFRAIVEEIRAKGACECVHADVRRSGDRVVERIMDIVGQRRGAEKQNELRAWLEDHSVKRTLHTLAVTSTVLHFALLSVECPVSLIRRPPGAMSNVADASFCEAVEYSATAEVDFASAPIAFLVSPGVRLHDAVLKKARVVLQPLLEQPMPTRPLPPPSTSFLRQQPPLKPAPSPPPPPPSPSSPRQQPPPPPPRPSPSPPRRQPPPSQPLLHKQPPPPPPSCPLASTPLPLSPGLSPTLAKREPEMQLQKPSLSPPSGPQTPSRKGRPSGERMYDYVSPKEEAKAAESDGPQPMEHDAA